MNRYEIQLPVTFKTGRFRLTPEQYRRRKHVVRLLDEHERLVEPITEISFKRGEVIETDLEMPKTLAIAVVPVAEAASEPPSAPAEPPAAPQTTDSPAADPEPGNGKRGRKGRQSDAP